MDLTLTFNGFWTQVASNLRDILSSPTQIVAHVAAGLGITLVVVAAFVRTMIPLRLLAVGSNVGLLIYGALRPSPITMIIAATLLPINIYRAIEMTRLTRRVNRAEVAGNQSGLWLRPYMKPRRLRAGQVLFRKGERADRMYLLVEGDMELADIGIKLDSGRIFGEIALFSPNKSRTHTVRCVTPCTVLAISYGTVKQLYFQNPAFGFHLIELLASRLGNDIERAERRLRESDTRPAS
ncbi:MAG: cyclic nucleotide-binding domain-containing protein [Burkholderiaceae bacterium]